METKNLILVLCKFNNCAIYNLKKQMAKDYEKNLKYLKTLKLKTNHLKMNMDVTVDGLTKKGADEIFALRNGLCDLEDYYEIKYDIEIQCPKLPCIVMKGGGTHLNFFPLELIEVV